MATIPEIAIRPVPEGIIRKIEAAEPPLSEERMWAGCLSSEIEDAPVVLDTHVFQDWPNIYAVFLLGCGHFSDLIWFRPKTLFDMVAVLKPITSGGWPFGCRECSKERRTNGSEQHS